MVYQQRHTRGLGREPKRREPRHVSSKGRRKRALLEILDALQELTDQDLERDPEDSMHGLDDGPDKDSWKDQFQRNGNRVFYMFRRRVNDLDQELQKLAQDFRQIGSAGVISSSYQLRMRLCKVLFLFSENAAELFPKVSREHPPDVPRSILSTVKGFPEELAHLGEDFTTFLRYLSEFPDLKQERLTSSVMDFQGDLEYWASCLREFKGQFRDPAVQRYVHEICGEMDHHLHSITFSIGSFVEVVVPNLRAAQQRAATTLVSLSGLATFVSAVTASVIQVAFEDTGGPLHNAVNAFWFSSLVFSVASAVNSLLVLVWTQSKYRSPRDRIPWCLSVWIRQSPLFFLVVALLAFSIGLVLFTWASSQHIITSLMTTAFTGISSLGFLTFSAWFALERFIFLRYNGQRLLADVVADVKAEWIEAILPQFSQRVSLWRRTLANDARRVGSSAIRRAQNICGPLIPSERQRNIHVDERELPVSHPASPLEGGTTVLPLKTISGTLNTPTALSDGSRLSLRSASTDPSPFGFRVELHPSDERDPFANPKLSQNSSTKYSLNMLETTQTVLLHQATVSCLQFSPDGNWLATSSWDVTASLFKIENGNALTPHRTLTHPRPVHQIAYAPDGHHLLTRIHSTGSIQVWSDDGVCLTKIERPRPVKSLNWLPRTQAFLSLEGELFSLEGSQVNLIDLKGNVLTSHHQPRLHLHDAAVTPDEVHMCAVAAVITSPDGLQPHRTRKESRIIVYNMAQKTVESQVPISHALEIIKLSSNGRFALVSCNYGGKNPTQLWHLNKFNNATHLSLSQTYLSNDELDFSGPSSFGGKHDELVLVFCTGKNGRVNIWDRDSATLLHTLLQPEGDLTCAAWNTASEFPMLATGSFDGTIRIWTTPCQRQTLDNVVTQSDSTLPSEEEEKSRRGKSMKVIAGILSDPPLDC